MRNIQLPEMHEPVANPAWHSNPRGVTVAAAGALIVKFSLGWRNGETWLITPPWVLSFVFCLCYLSFVVYKVLSGCGVNVTLL